MEPAGFANQSGLSESSDEKFSPYRWNLGLTNLGSNIAGSGNLQAWAAGTFPLSIAGSGS
jgi:hypothetical protein